MSISKALKLKFSSFTEKERKNIIKMSIEDKTSFQEIQTKFSLTPGEVEKFLLKELGEKRFKRWKLRQQKRSTKKNRPILS